MEIKLNISIDTINFIINDSDNFDSKHDIAESTDLVKSTNVSSKLLEDYTWEEINNIVKQGKHKELFKIGDTKSFRLGDEILEAQIADFDHDYLIDNGIIIRGISFILKNCMRLEYFMNSSNTNAGGWYGSAMYKYLNTDIYDQLPSDLQSVIKPINKITGQSNKSITLEVSTDKLWLMSEKEIFGNNQFSKNNEGKQYPIFTDNDSRIKKVNDSYGWYWLRSPYVSSSTYFCGVYNDGSLGYSGASYSHGVAFGFCI